MKFLMCIGGTKCGTTYFYNLLSSLDDLNPCRVKEPSFFSNNFDKGFSWYYSLWKQVNGVKFECSANYIYSDNAIIRIKEFSEENNIRIALIFRNSRKRSLSHLDMLLRYQKPSDVIDFVYKNFDDIVGRSLIYPQIKRLDQAGLLDKVDFIGFDELIEKPNTVLKKFGFNIKESDILTLSDGKGYSSVSPLVSRARNWLAERLLELGISSSSNIFLKSIDNLYKKYFTKEKNQLTNSQLTNLNSIFDEYFISDMDKILKEYPDIFNMIKRLKK